MLKWLKSFISGRYYDNAPADRLFLNFIARITEDKFLSRLHIKDDFHNRTAVFTAFMFCWLNYFDRQGEKQLRRQFIDLTVKLLDDSLRDEGTSDMRIGKKVKYEMQAFYASLLAYDKLFGDHNGNPPPHDLQQLLQKYIITESPLAEFANYLLAFRKRLDKINLEDLLQSETAIDDLFI